jgi:hypothetical protein
MKDKMIDIQDIYWLHRGQHYATKFDHNAKGLVNITYYRHGSSYRRRWVGLDLAVVTLKDLEAEGYA